MVRDVAGDGAGAFGGTTGAAAVVEVRAAELGAGAGRGAGAARTTVTGSRGGAVRTEVTVSAGAVCTRVVISGGVAGAVCAGAVAVGRTAQSRLPVSAAPRAEPMMSPTALHLATKTSVRRSPNKLTPTAELLPGIGQGCAGRSQAQPRPPGE